MVEVKRILVVDDHFRILDSVKSMLESSGKEIEVVGVPSAEEGILEIRRESVDLLITDIYLPGMSGAELIVRVNRLLPELPIIVITGHAEKMSPEEAASSGIVSYFEKPVEPAAFIKAVHSALAGSAQSESEPVVDGSVEHGQNKTLALRFLIESLRADTGSAEVLLGTLDGKILYVTGGRESALTVLVENFSEAVMGLYRLADRMGCDSPFTFQSISDDQIELFFASIGSGFFVSILYYDESRIAETDTIYAKVKETLASANEILRDEQPSETTIQPTEAPDRVDEVEPQILPEYPSEVVESDSLIQALEDVSKDTDSDLVELPNVDEAVDLDAFWDDALTSELEGDEVSKGLDFEEAQKLGLIPPKFDPKKKSQD
jgi:DNA-binding NarL/FixJ family response regulator